MCSGYCGESAYSQASPHVRVVINRHDDVIPAVVHRAPRGQCTRRLFYDHRPASAAPQVTRSGYERAVLLTDVIEYVHHGIGFSDVGGRLIRQHPIHRVMRNNRPLPGSPGNRRSDEGKPPRRRYSRRRASLVGVQAQGSLRWWRRSTDNRTGDRRESEGFAIRRPRCG